MKRAAILRAVAVPVAPPSSADSSEYRKQLSESYGFEKIGEPLPENVRLKDIVESLPKEVLHLPQHYSVGIHPETVHVFFFFNWVK